MKRIKLTRGYYAKIDDRDYQTVSAHKWFADVRKDGTVYAATSGRVNGNRSTIRMHCLLLGTVGQKHRRIGEHQNGDGLDNRRKNIRPASQKQNSWNTRGQKGVGFLKGITKQKRLTKRPWQARIHRSGVTLHLGYFPTKEEAATAYNKAASLNDGEFLKLNPVDVGLSDNFLRDVILREHVDQMLVYLLSCGHGGYVPWHRRLKVGEQKHCKTCEGA